MHLPKKILAALLATMLLGACSMTHFEHTWQDPEATFGELHGEKVVGFLISDDESKRQEIENALARELTARGGRGVAGHKVLSAEEAQDEEMAAEKLIAAGVDAVITMRYVSEEQLVSTTTGSWHQEPAYAEWGDYWYPSWRSAFEPDFSDTHTVARVETLIYEMESGKLIWAGLSKTHQPAKANAFIRELASEIDKAISK